MAAAFIGLGANLGDRKGNIARAKKMLKELPGVDILRESSIEETKAVDVTDQPDFLNQIVMVRTDIPPLELLRSMLDIESAMGRVRTVRGGPRVIDLDLLLYGGETMDTVELRLPHPEIVRRPFVLKQLLEISPGLREPATGKPYREVYDAALEKHQ
ncbi:MAG TPA: 2-amino-4-hydroxy-6-hydroxymethyldihydropteridine diphosphokinase [Spirochaetota bacterium]|jgi:2-amino-4-hydroxy-6-hydroxymethyldihydropteridine diphosphokinase|nr:2-amino-4-hydroxy-6-hydroxymethyldihydropteridine diphosphokinase [Spirochaetota bacterium]